MLRQMIWRILVLTTLLAVLYPPAEGQTLGGVFGPAVKEGTQETQYRFAWVPGENGGSDRFGHRLHWQRALDSRRMVRLIATADGTAGNVEPANLSVQLLQELTPEGPRAWRSAVRVELGAGLNGRASYAGFHWSNEVQLEQGWSARAVALSSVQFGENARDGVFLQSRFRLNRKFSGGTNAGIEMFNSYGSTEAFGRFDEQNHRAGPYVTLPLAEGWTFYTGALFGLSDRAADTEARFWIGRAF